MSPAVVLAVVTCPSAQVLRTGGGADFIYPNGSYTPFAQTGQLLLDLVIEANQQGTYMPLWGTPSPFRCLPGAAPCDTEMRWMLQRRAWGSSC